jgi:hypothetical protein
MKRRLLFSIRLLGWLALGLLTLEACARLEDKLAFGAPLLGNYSIDTLYGYDSMGKVGLPEHSYLKWHLNNVGYRGPDLRKGTYRIACLGSSETFGMYESAGMEWPRQLETDLNERESGDRFEVVDAAYPGMSMNTSLERLPQLLAAVHPQMVVIYPAYSSYIEGIPHAVAPAGPRTPARARDAGVEWRLEGRLETLSKVALPAAVQNWMRSESIALAVRGKTTIDQVPEKNVQAFGSDLDAVGKGLLQQGVKVILVTHANRFGRQYEPADDDMLTNWRKFYPTLKQPGFLDMENRMSAVVRQVASANNVPLVDGAAIVPPGKVNFADFAHFTDSGSRILADAIASQVVREEPDVAQDVAKKN